MSKEEPQYVGATDEEQDEIRKMIVQDAHDAGRADYEIGLPATANPFTNIELRAAWSDGWCDALADDHQMQFEEMESVNE